jgi:polyphosphate kinase
MEPAMQATTPPAPREAASAAEQGARRVPELHDPQLFLNRELSWLQFNSRVLEEAAHIALPIFERLKFLAIVSSNLDEFFMVRVAGLKQQQLGGVSETAADGLLPNEQLEAISTHVHSMMEEQHRIWSEDILPCLQRYGLHLVTPDAFDPQQRTAARAHFAQNVFPTLTPLAVDPGHPFPHLRNKSINVAVLLRKEGRRRRKDPRDTSLAVVQVPAVLERLVRIPSASGQAFVLLEDIIAAFAGDLFPGYAVKQATAFRVTRNWDLDIDEEESEDLLNTVRDELRRRDRGAAVRLELAGDAPPDLAQSLAGALKLAEQDIYRVRCPLQPIDLLALVEVDSRPELRVELLQPSVPPDLQETPSMFATIAARDVLLHHPYESFEPVVRFIQEAADDPKVLAIKHTLYRTSGDSPFVQALSRAAENGKQVTVLVEIKARFDEANNIAWARRLEDAGVHVVYGLIGLKTHCKIALVVRREDRIRRYAHLGTGNYNPNTARQYTDISIFSAREELADDASALFNLLTGYAEPPQWKRFAVAPFGLQERILALIEREAQRARAGEPARIVAKMNSLVDPSVIRALYAASAAGVSIDLLVRGICCLRPGIPGTSENIRVVSVVDRFLEHSRIFSFGAGDRAEVFVSSADWMPRNFTRRIEVMFPVDDPALRGRLLNDILAVSLSDGVKARRLAPDGTYSRVQRTEGAVRSQEYFLQRSRRLMDSARRNPAIRPVTAPTTAS